MNEYPEIAVPHVRDPGARRIPVVGLLPAGARNAITDVAGIRVGHVTLADGPVQTGVTVIHPHGDDPYRNKVPAASAVINGFGKSVGLIQLDELGQLETPIALTNTFSVGAVAQAQIRQALARNPDIGRSLPTVNPLVLECNDGFLNDIQKMHVSEADYRSASDSAGHDLAQGAVGAGRGMSSFQMKGGIGTASREVSISSVRAGAGGMIEDVMHRYTVGALVLSNYGLMPNLIWGGEIIGPRIMSLLEEESRQAFTYVDHPEKGSIIMILATDAPLDARQLRRLAGRAAAGLARTGSIYGHGSGDIAVAFSTAYTVPHTADRPMPPVTTLHETRIDALFQAAADTVEQAIIHALWHAEPVTGRDGNHRPALRDLLTRLDVRAA
ncbi:D-aminopeptidase [Robbsia andropogonis]|uniref:D-aminopeptidase n=1 Tax=Robbsia andropogonis TaxID=28092 RepID=A0A0F5K452_9BURK|nr:P1 family peptidase [Robbsia andropogonis]KKB64873.1 D-aminopeptidase [Robbsia andropogonis]MCP1119125.1 P1 family peptidase [Robbsia andropogonis]MCP1129024.1 P1 family peptidase [Robbsia andropogonis]